MNNLIQDLRYAFRQLKKNLGFTTIAVVTLALAIGANTAIFSVVHRVLLQPLPYPHPDRLAMIWGKNLSRGDEKFPISPGDFSDWKQKNGAFEDIAASYDNEVTLTGVGEPKLVLGYAFTPNFFAILGVSPELGRTFTEDEAQNKAEVVVLSDKYWRSTFHADPQILGKAITLDAKAYTVIGVMPPGFDWPPKTELWMPFSLSSANSADYGHHYIRVMGRLKPKVSVEQAQAQMNALEQQVVAQHPQTDAGNEAVVDPLRQELAGDIRAPLLALFGAVCFVLLIACANLAGLVLARAASRKGELSVRLAIGATPFRILQQYLTEGVVVAIAGGATGLVLALWCTRFLVTLFPNDIYNLSIPRVESIPINAPVLWFALGITIITALLFSTIPALLSSKVNAGDVMKETSRSASSGSHVARVRRVLVTGEIALSLLLLTGAVAMIESFRNVYHEDLGFRTRDLLGVEVFLPLYRYPDDQPQKRLAFINRVLGNLRKLPGVQSAAATNFLPLTGFGGQTDFTIEGQTARDLADKPQADKRLVTPEYFSTMGIPLLRGRFFTDSDRAGSEHVAIVNATLAHRYFGVEDPIGKALHLGDPAHPEQWVIVGEVGDVRAFGQEKPAHADLYRPLAQVSFPLLAFTVRASGDPSFLLNPAKQAIWSVDKDQPIFDAVPMSLLAAQSITLRRVSAMLLGSFAGVSLVLAAVGLFGLMAYSVTQRTHEIGIRMALGAQRADVLRQTLSGGIRLLIVGEIAGLLAAMLALRAASSLFYGVSPGDPLIPAGAAAMLILVAVAATYIPARRAANLDPIVALRHE